MTSTSPSQWKKPRTENCSPHSWQVMEAVPTTWSPLSSRLSNSPTSNSAPQKGHSPIFFSSLAIVGVATLVGVKAEVIVNVFGFVVIIVLAGGRSAIIGVVATGVILTLFFPVVTAIALFTFAHFRIRLSFFFIIAQGAEFVNPLFDFFRREVHRTVRQPRSIPRKWKECR